MLDYKQRSHFENCERANRSASGSITDCTMERSLLISALSGILFLATAEVDVISKESWEGEASAGNLDKLSLPVQRVIICHTAGSDCNDVASCGQQLRNIQRFHMQKMGFSDIAYNFMIGNDGKVYEGRGWEYVGAYARGYNVGSIGVAFIGNYMEALPSERALQAASALIAEGVSLSKVSEDFQLLGHRQVTVTSSPGNALYERLKMWPHFSAGAKN